MYKIKTKSAAKKRFKKLPGGKIKRSRAYHRHLLTKKSATRKRNLRQSGYVSDSDYRHIASLLPYA